MKILAIEFASSLRSAAVLKITFSSGCDPVSILGEARVPTPQPAHPTSLVEHALATAGLEREDVEGLAVGLGPGSYTGIRMSIAFAQGWQLARPVQVTGASSAECLAHQLKAAGHRGLVQIAIDAQRNEFCLGRYLLSETEVREQQPLALAPAAALKAILDKKGTLAGPDLARRIPGAIDLYPDAASLGRLACARQQWVSADTLNPIYLRPVQFVRAPTPRPME